MMRPLLSCLFLSLAAASMAQAAPAKPAASKPAAAPVPGPAAETLIKTDTKVGTGAEALAGSTVDVHYTGWLYVPTVKGYKGRKFDSSRDRKEPISFELGTGRVIQGWDQGILGMKVGGKRTLTIPSEMAYGERGAGNGVIPPGAALLFEVELVSVK
jgi:FKBP-type peptidyl-prolyl cis-trans isomerase FkpA